MSNATIFPPATERAATEMGAPSLETTTKPATPLTSAGLRRVGERLPRNLGGPADDPRHDHRATVHAQHDLGVQQGDQVLEAPVTCGREERIDDLALTPQVGIRDRSRPANAAAGPAGKLP